MKKLLAMGLFGMSSLACATDTISVARVTPYVDGAANIEVRKECTWNKKIGDNIARQSKGRVAVTDQDLSQVKGPVLMLSVTIVHTMGGGLFTGPKWARVKGELRDGDKLVGLIEMHRTTTFSSVSGCGALDKIGKEIASDFADWLEHPTIETPEPDEEPTT